MNALDPFYIVAGALTSPFWARKSRSGWGARFGKGKSIDRIEKPRILLHAVSVGEVSALRTLVPLLAEHAHVIVSATTDTGFARARALYAQPDHPLATVVRYPLDFSWAVRRFLNRVNPDAVGLVELELWPNFIGACRAREIPVGVINGRLSSRSFRNYSKARLMLRKMFASLAFAAVQNEAYAVRFRHMGVASNRVHITDTMKWDAATVEDRVEGSESFAREMGIDPSCMLIVGGSTGPGAKGKPCEEAMLRDAVKAACPEGTQLLCAPRKPERFEQAAAALKGCTRRSNRAKGNRAQSLFLLDTIGELRKAYALADVVVIGRSFGSLYGSDPIEAIALGKATVIGPRASDFQSTVDAFTEVGGIVQTTADQLPEVLARLIGDRSERSALGERGRECILAHQGASQRHADLLLGLVSARS